MSSSVEIAASAPSVAMALEASVPHDERPRTTSTLDTIAMLKESPRTAYLPLVSPHVEQKPKTTTAAIGTGTSSEPSSSFASSSHKRRRSSASEIDSQQKNGEVTKASYFDIEKAQAHDNVDSEKRLKPTDSPKKLRIGTHEDADKEKDVAATPSSPQSTRNKLPVVELPDAIASPLIKALESSFVGQSIDRQRQYRALSVPHNMRSSKQPTQQVVGATRSSFASPSSSTASPQQRRDSMRAQQLALLASQARLASTGTTSVTTALRAEKAMKGAVWKAVENVQARKERASIAGVPVNSTDDNQKEQEKEFERRASSKDGLITPATAATTDPVNTWSEALANPRSATMFMDSVEEVAHDWANGFYAYEKKWVGDALQRVQARSQSIAVSDLASPSSPPPLSPTDSGPASAGAPVVRRTSLSAPPPTTTSSEVGTSRPGELLAAGMHHTTDTMDIALGSHSNANAAQLALMGAQRRISVALPAKRVSVTASVDGSSNEEVTERTIDLRAGGGKLLDVLSNFATLIDSRKEGCHSLEKLAHNARRLSAVQLPTMQSVIGSSVGARSYVGADAATAGLTSALGSSDSSPVSVASPRC